MFIYDPLSYREWQASQAASEFKKTLRHCEEETGMVHPLSDAALSEKLPTISDKPNPNAGVVQAFPKGRW